MSVLATKINNPQHNNYAVLLRSPIGFNGDWFLGKHVYGYSLSYVNATKRQYDLSFGHGSFGWCAWEERSLMRFPKVDLNNKSVFPFPPTFVYLQNSEIVFDDSKY